jgi:hypothetical protein
MKWRGITRTALWQLAQGRVGLRCPARLGLVVIRPRLAAADHLDRGKHHRIGGDLSGMGGSEGRRESEPQERGGGEVLSGVWTIGSGYQYRNFSVGDVMCSPSLQLRCTCIRHRTVGKSDQYPVPARHRVPKVGRRMTGSAVFDHRNDAFEGA